MSSAPITEKKKNVLLSTSLQNTIVLIISIPVTNSRGANWSFKISFERKGLKNRIEPCKGSTDWATHTIAAMGYQEIDGYEQKKRELMEKPSRK